MPSAVSLRLKGDMMRYALLLLAPLACSSSSTDGVATGPCAQRTAGYVIKYTVRSGNCGASAETVVPAGPQPTAPAAPCTGTITYSADNCEVNYTSDCPADVIAKGARSKTTGKAKWSRDGATGTAVEELLVTKADGTGICQGTYDLTATRQ